MRVLAKMRRSANHDIHAINARFHGNAGVIHVAADVGKDLSFEPKLANGLAILSRLLRGSR